MRWLLPGVVFALVATAGSARPQDGLDKYVMEAYGGTAMSDCG
jgi:hypothetical protein